MTYLVASDLPQGLAGGRFRVLLARPGIAQIPGTQSVMDQTQTRAALYATIDYAGCEALDQSIVSTVVPQGMPQDTHQEAPQEVTRQG